MIPDNDIHMSFSGPKNGDSDWDTDSSNPWDTDPDATSYLDSGSGWGPDFDAEVGSHIDNDD